MFRVWYSTESLADFIIDHTSLAARRPIKQKLYESDANNPTKFHTMPDHIRQILYLDSPDLIIERDSEPIFSIEISTEAGTGHNAFQRFARIAASVENGVPAFYIYPEAVIIQRQSTGTGWDVLNPAIFAALEAVMEIYDIPALLYYFPGDYPNSPSADTEAGEASNFNVKGLDLANNIKYAGCPNAARASMQRLFRALNLVINASDTSPAADIMSIPAIRDHRTWMSEQYVAKAAARPLTDMSPLSATLSIKTSTLLAYLKQYESGGYRIGELLRGRPVTLIYRANAKFRGDPYPGALAAVDYLACRTGTSFEDRRCNLVLAFGHVTGGEAGQPLEVADQNGSTISDLFAAVQNSESANLLTKDYNELRPFNKPRYLMQMRYGSTYSKRKDIRVYSYFADAILFPDGALWRDG